jgi:hypothetical protein
LNLSSVDWLQGSSLGTRRAVTRRIIQANIDRLKLLLETETDPTKRAMELKLLAEEEAKLLREPKDKKAAD